MILGVAQIRGGVGADQVGAPHRPVEHRPAGEDPLHLSVGREGIAHVMVGVPGSVQYLQPHSPRLDHLTISGADMVEPDAAVGRQNIGRSGPLRQFQTASDVVVVYMGLQHMRDPYPELVD